MRRRFISLYLVLMLLCTLFKGAVTVNAEEDSLAPYYAILEEINEKLGTNYAFSSEEQLMEMGESYSDLVEFYTKMSMEEFKDYVQKAHKNATEYSNKVDCNVVVENNYEIEPLAYGKTQRYYYDTSGINYFYIVSTLYSADGEERYSRIDENGYTSLSYPYYESVSMTHSYSSGNTEVTCTYIYKKVITPYLIDSTKYSLAVTFEASGGDVYE